MTHGILRPGCCPARHGSSVRISCAYPFPEDGWEPRRLRGYGRSEPRDRQPTVRSGAEALAPKHPARGRGEASPFGGSLSKLDRENPPGVLAADPIADIARESVHPGEAPRHVPDVVGI